MIWRGLRWRAPPHRNLANSTGMCKSARRRRAVRYECRHVRVSTYRHFAARDVDGTDPQSQTDESSNTNKELILSNLFRFHRGIPVLLCAALPLLAHAAAERTFVSSSGADANEATNCAPTAPCRTFAAALAVTNPGGEIIVLDSAGYGALNISQSVSITAPAGIYAGIVASTGVNAINITDGSNTINVALRGLTINGSGGPGGVIMTGGASLLVEGCEIIGNPATGGSIYVSGSINVRVVDTVVRDGNWGIMLENGVTGDVIHSRLLNNTVGGLLVFAGIASSTNVAVSDTAAIGGNNGFLVQANATGANLVLAVDRSTAAGNTIGFEAESVSGGTSQLTVSNSLAQNNATGIYTSGSGASAYASGDTITEAHNSGIHISAGTTLTTFGTNSLSGNVTDVDNQGTLTTKARM